MTLDGPKFLPFPKKPTLVDRLKEAPRPDEADMKVLLARALEKARAMHEDPLRPNIDSFLQGLGTDTPDVIYQSGKNIETRDGLEIEHVTHNPAKPLLVIINLERKLNGNLSVDSYGTSSLEDQNTPLIRETIELRELSELRFFSLAIAGDEKQRAELREQINPALTPDTPIQFPEK